MNVVYCMFIAMCSQSILYEHRYDSYDKYISYMFVRRHLPRALTINRLDIGIEATLHWNELIANSYKASADAITHRLPVSLLHYFTGYLYAIYGINIASVMPKIDFIDITYKKSTGKYSFTLMYSSNDLAEMRKQDIARINSSKDRICDNAGREYSIPTDIIEQPLQGRVAAIKHNEFLFVAIYSDDPTQYVVFRFSTLTGKLLNIYRVWGYTPNTIYRGSFRHYVALKIHNNSIVVLGVALNCFYVEKYNIVSGKPESKTYSFLP